MTKKSMRWAGTLVIVVLVAAVAGAGVWMYMQQQVDAANSRANSLSNQLSQAATASAAYLELTEAGNFDFIDEIDGNGGVAADDTGNDATPAPTLAMENKDTQDDATNVYITMWDPESSVGGVPTALEDTTMSFYVTYNGVLVPLYLNTNGVGAYTNGVNIGTLTVGSSVSALTFSAVADAAADDTYDDSAATYTVKAFVYQADAQDSTPASWTLYT